MSRMLDQLVLPGRKFEGETSSRWFLNGCQSQGRVFQAKRTARREEQRCERAQQVAEWGCGCSFELRGALFGDARALFLGVGRQKGRSQLGPSAHSGHFTDLCSLS